VVTHGPRPIAELISAAIDWTRNDGWADWDAMTALRQIAIQEVLGQALGLVAHDDPRVRARGVDSLGQLGSLERTFPEQCLKATIDHRPVAKVA
jgi:hypothetical protein